MGGNPFLLMGWDTLKSGDLQTDNHPQILIPTRI